MEGFFNAKHVALIGASSNVDHPGHQIFLNMEASFGDNFYAVNPKGSIIGTRVCYKSILEVPADIDLAVVFIQAKGVPAVLKQCAEKGIKRVIIESGGFAETGSEGKALHEQCLNVANASGMRLWGPNCMGLINVQRMKVLSFMRKSYWEGKFQKGNVSLVVQSGMLSAGFLAMILTKTPFGLSKVASIGNKMDIDESDLLEYLISDPETGVIAFYLESIKDGRRFYNLCRSTDKPIVVLKSGRSDSGAQAAASHTASLAQNDLIIDAALKQAGVVRVYDMNDLIDAARVFGSTAVSSKAKMHVAVLTFSGGAGVVAADSLSDAGLFLATFQDETLAQLNTVFPAWMEPSNPVDLYPAIVNNGSQKVFHTCLKAVLNDPGVDAVYFHMFAMDYLAFVEGFDEIADLSKRRKKPLIAWLMGDDALCSEMRSHLEQAGVITADTISKGVDLLAALTLRGQ